jgi:predicted RNA-binding Zn-ribbon protein involved in translation (DUF1610 family)
MSSPIRRLPKWLDRAGFEADKLMRANRVKAEASRMRDHAEDKTHSLGLKVLELASAGTQIDPALQELVDEIMQLHSEAAKKDEEAKAINAEQWVEPAPPTPIAAPGAPPQASRPADPIAERLQSYIDSKKNASFNCPKCGAVIRSNATFCPRCGRKVLR